MYLGIRSHLWRNYSLHMNLRAGSPSYLRVCPLIVLASSWLIAASPTSADEGVVHQKVNEKFILMDSKQLPISDLKESKKDLEVDHKAESVKQLPKFQIDQKSDQNDLAESRNGTFELLPELKQDEVVARSPQENLTHQQTDSTTAQTSETVFGHLNETGKSAALIGTPFSKTAITHPFPALAATYSKVDARSHEPSQPLLAQASPEKAKPEQAATQNSRLLLGSPSIQLQGEREKIPRLALGCGCYIP